MRENSKQIKIALICGGPSKERGISLNSARCIMDHLNDDDIQIHPYYVDNMLNFHKIATRQLYSNTPNDFDFILQNNHCIVSIAQFIAQMKGMDVVFPAIHGAFGEDGHIQRLLSSYNINYIGSSDLACRKMFNKAENKKILSQHGFPTVPSLIIEKQEVDKYHKIINFFEQNNMKRAVVKPSAGGSSIGVFAVDTTQQALTKIKYIMESNIDDKVLIEPFLQGQEFTVIVLSDHHGQPVALIPSYIKIDQGEIFDYRRKYLPTANTQWLCPAPFDTQIMQTIRTQAQQLFKIFAMADFARLDGWVLHDDITGKDQVVFSDLNPISGMEQNSFIFQQSARVGMTHSQVLRHIIKNKVPAIGTNNTITVGNSSNNGKITVNILMGGGTAERHVSVMSGTNVWLKLLRSNIYNPVLYLLSSDNNTVWKLPYSYSLNHSVEEIEENCQNTVNIKERTQYYLNDIQQRLSIDGGGSPNEQAQSFAFDEFLEKTKHQSAHMFLCLHGGIGEDGTMQQRLEQMKIPFNGSRSDACKLCMDKYKTGQVIGDMNHEFIMTAKRIKFNIGDIADDANKDDYINMYNNYKQYLNTSDLLIKPVHDGCSAGIIPIQTAMDLQKYLQLLKSGADHIPMGTFSGQSSIIEMPMHNQNTELMIEPFIKTDEINVDKGKLIHNRHEGWVELTVGVLEKNGSYQALDPSITLAGGAVLSLEEKFQSGTGVNLTPPPLSIIGEIACQHIKKCIVEIAMALNIAGYARIDIFYNLSSRQVMVIEANALPGLTAATVLYHQGLAFGYSPLQLLEAIINNTNDQCMDKAG